MQESCLRCPRSTSCPRPGVVTLKSHPEPEARGGSWEEPPTPEDRAGSQEQHPEEQRLHRHRRAWRSYPTLKVRRCGCGEIPLSGLGSSGCALLEQQ